MLRTRRRDDDQGAALIYTVVILVGLLATATFVVDFGILMLARRQAQNAADAAAYAGAVALAQDVTGDRGATGPATQNAIYFGLQNRVWGAPVSVLAADVTFPTCPVDHTDACVRVEVHRTQARGNPLPTVFGRLAGLMTQDLRATATAEVRPSNVSKCLKPWAVPDRWTETTGGAATFDKYDPTAPNGTLFASPDQYVAPSASTTGTGYRLNRDLGTSLTLTQGCSGSGSSTAAARGCPQAALGNFLPVNFAPGCPSSNYQSAITGCATTCTGDPVTVGLTQPLNYLPSGTLTALASATTTGVNTLIAQDPGAVYNPVTKKIENSCVGGGGVPYTCAQAGLVESPRIIAMPAYDVGWFEDHSRKGGGGNASNLIKVSNVLSVFLDSVSSGIVSTHIVAKSGPWDPSRPVVTGGAAFTRTILIVR